MFENFFLPLLIDPNTITSLSRLDFLWFEHLGYTTTLIAFYFLPLLLFKSKNLYLLIKNFFLEKLANTEKKVKK